MSPLIGALSDIYGRKRVLLISMVGTPIPYMGVALGVLIYMVNSTRFAKYTFSLVQWNLSIKDAPNRGHLSNEDTVCSPNYIGLCTNLPQN